MKATGIVRRVEECVIIGQTAPNPHKHYGFRRFVPLNALVSKTGFWRFYINVKTLSDLNGYGILYIYEEGCI